MEDKKRFSDKRNLILCLLIALLGLGGYLSLSRRQHADQLEKPAGKVLQSTGEVQMRREIFQNWRSATKDSPLFNNSTVYTQAASEAVLRLHEVEVRLGEKTLIQIVEPEKKDEVWMDFGSFVVSAQEKRALTLKVGGKTMRLGFEKAQLQVLRSEEGLTEIRSLQGRIELEIDGKIQTVEAQSSLHFDLPNENSPPATELIARNQPPVEAPGVFPRMSRRIAASTDEHEQPPSEASLSAPTSASASASASAPPSPPADSSENKTSHRKWKPTSFQFGLGGNYIWAKEDSPYSNSELQGFSGPTVYAQVWMELSDSIGLDFSYLSVRSNVQAALYGVNARATVDWSSMSLGVFSKKGAGVPLLRAGLYRQELPLFFETDSQIILDRAQIYSLYLGYGRLIDLRPDLFFMWDGKFLLPVSSSASGSIESFKPGLGIEGTLGVYKCLSENWSLGVSSMLQYQPANYNAPYGSSGPSMGYSSQLLNISNQLRVIHGACGRY